MDSDLKKIDGVRGRHRLDAQEARRLDAQTYLDALWEMQRNADLRDGSVRDTASMLDANHGMSAEAHKPARQQHGNPYRAYAMPALATTDKLVSAQAHKGKMAHAAQAAESARMAQHHGIIPELTVRNVGSLEAAHAFISGEDPHTAEVERLGINDEVGSEDDVKHVWEVFMEHRYRTRRPRS